MTERLSTFVSERLRFSLVLALTLAACVPSFSSEHASPEGICAKADLSDSGRIVAIYEVEDGEVGGLCFGEANQVLLDNWNQLADIAPRSELEAVSVLAGFDDPDGDTAAFTSPLNGVNSSFVVAVNLPVSVEDPAESRLTLVHEIAHVFTLEKDQINFKTVPSKCDNYHDGLGCFDPDSYIQNWVNEFWSPEQLASLPSDGAIDEDGGEDRCSIDPTFVGGYAASHPEEDFAESFSAYVFDVEVADEMAPKMAFFDNYPELVEFRTQERQRAEEFENNFGRCG